MSTKINFEFRPEDWIAPAEAARLRGVTRQAITKLIRTERITVLEIGGRPLVKRSEIVNFKPRKPGRQKCPKASNDNS